MKTIGFIGLGLIGGSIAKAIRKYHPDYHILAYNRSKEALASAISTGIIDGVCEEMKDPRFGSCDYVFLCAPVEINLECLAYLKEIRQPGCIPYFLQSTNFPSRQSRRHFPPFFR
mgnify:CR=1 FL=1